MTDLEKLKNISDIQSSNGNWNYDPYMHGMANGLICALAILENKEPQYLEAPKQWLRDLSLPSLPTSEAETK